MHSEEHPTSVPFGVRPDSNFGLFCNNDVYQQFRFLSHIIFACSLTVSVANSLAASSRLPLLLVLRKGYCVPFRFLMGITDHFVNGRRRRRYGGSSHLEDNQSSDLRVTRGSCSQHEDAWNIPSLYGFQKVRTCQNDKCLYTKYRTIFSFCNLPPFAVCGRMITKERVLRDALLYSGRI